MAQKRVRAQDMQGMQHPASENPDHATLGEGVLINGVDADAARRAHMRDLTTARQAAGRGHMQSAHACIGPKPCQSTLSSAHRHRGPSSGILKSAR